MSEKEIQNRKRYLQHRELGFKIYEYLETDKNILKQSKIISKYEWELYFCEEN